MGPYWPLRSRPPLFWLDSLNLPNVAQSCPKLSQGCQNGAPSRPKGAKLVSPRYQKTFNYNVVFFTNAGCQQIWICQDIRIFFGILLCVNLLQDHSNIEAASQISILGNVLKYSKSIFKSQHVQHIEHALDSRVSMVLQLLSTVSISECRFTVLNMHLTSWHFKGNTHNNDSVHAAPSCVCQTHVAF